MKREAVVIHSGGLDSSVCLALAIRQWGKERVVSVTFNYGQRHAIEVSQAAKICEDWGVEHRIFALDVLAQLTENALTDHSLPIEHEGAVPNTFVCCRNGLMARLGAIYAAQLGAKRIYMGVMQVDYYPDCSREYMDLMQQILRMDLWDNSFEICTPLVHLDKAGVLQIAHQLGLLDYLLEETVYCYAGVLKGCGLCPACKMRSDGLAKFYQSQLISIS